MHPSESAADAEQYGDRRNCQTGSTSQLLYFKIIFMVLDFEAPICFLGKMASRSEPSFSDDEGGARGSNTPTVRIVQRIFGCPP